MENYDLILDLVEYPEKYSPDEVREFLAHPEMKEFYETLCKTSSALNSNDRISDEFIDSEWQRLHSEYTKKQKQYNRIPSIRSFLPSSRVASFTIILLTSLAALAFGIAVTVSVVDKKSGPKHDEISSGHSDTTTLNNDSVTVSPKYLKAKVGPVIFEDAPLEDILKAISEYYGVDVNFKSQETAGIHLFYKFDSKQSIDEILEQLNTFDRIDISKEGNTLIVE